MAGAQLTGGKADITIAKKPIANNPAYPPSGPKKKIRKESEAQLKTVNVPPGKIKIGVRVKQTENVEQFEIVGKNGQQLALTPAPPQETPPNNPVAQDLGTALGVAGDEKWVTYTAQYDPATFGKKFATKLVLNPFECHPNGVRIFTVAITFDGLTFTNDHYVYGISVLPGENSKSFPISLGAPGPSKKPAAKKKATKKKATKKTSTKRR